MVSRSAGKAVFGVVLVLFSAPFVGVGFNFGAKQAIDTWQANSLVDDLEPTNATVLNTSVDRKVEVQKGRTGTTNRTYYAVSITYNYTVDGSTYESSKVVPALRAPYTRSFDNESAASAYVADHNQSVTAYYDPTDPDTAYLQTDVPGGVGGNLAVAVVLAVCFGGLGLVCFLLGLKFLAGPIRRRLPV